MPYRDKTDLPSRLQVRSPFVQIRIQVAILVGAAIGCAHTRQPLTTSGPDASPEGVRLALMSQSCKQSGDSDRSDDDQLVEELVGLEIRNPTPVSLTIHRDRIRLVTSGGLALRTLTSNAAAAVLVAPGATTAFELRFMASDLSCGKEMGVDAATAFELNGEPVKLGVVRFVPSGSTPLRPSRS